MSPRVVSVEELACAVRATAAEAGGELVLVGVAGIPGSGKTTLCASLAERLPSALALPMDGFHLPLERLKEFTDPADALYRRGVPGTFDRAGFAQQLAQLAGAACAREEVGWPGFDPVKGDPVPDQNQIRPSQHRIVLVEGLWTLHWAEAAKHFDLRVYVEARRWVLGDG